MKAICFIIQFYCNPVFENKKDPIEKSKNPTKITHFSNAEKSEKASTILKLKQKMEIIKFVQGNNKMSQNDLSKHFPKKFKCVISRRAIGNLITNQVAIINKFMTIKPDQLNLTSLKNL